ncbi:type VII secretion protein EccCa [Kitasatospora sp. NPDC057936]|uniref:type VII secretion protein EccCa n=1 Tax=Kitasatospora sp. NPDC057936 TaxID=3346283 RepID=UPI0036D8BCB6
MSTRLIHRPARTVRPPAAPEARTIEAPPNLPEGKAGNIAMSLLPMAGVMSSVIMMTVVRNSQFAGLGAIILLVTVLGSVGLLFSQRGKAQRTRRTQREAYLTYLEDLREELAAEERARGDHADVLNPPPGALYDIVRDPARLWERRRVDGDFLRVRVGTGEMPVRDLRIGQQASSAMTPPDRFMLNEASALTTRFRTGTELPLTVPLDRVGDVSVIGPREDCLRVARALLTQSAALHAPDDVAVALAVPGERLPDWEWAKWLPHLLDTDQYDGPVAARRIAPSMPQLARQIGAELRRRASYATEVRRGLSGSDALSMTSRLLVVADGHGEDAVDLPRPDDAVGLREMGVTVLHLLERRVQEPGQIGVRITVEGDQVLIEDLRQEQPISAHGTVDEVGPSFAEGLARMLAPLRLSAESLGDAPLSGPVEFAGLLGIDDVAHLDLARLWAPRGERAFLRVPIGISDSHEPVLLDLKESSELGMGPHGLCVGATGSGKSELLRSLVLALVATHPPEDLSLVLVDYKGGATFAPFANLPHVAGVITNLENQAGLVERVHASLAGEVKRRQQVLKDAGNVADIGSYAALRAERRPDLEPLPHLFVVIDEFGELLTAKPDFIDLFLSIGRIGRSIGVHLLLSSQRIEGGSLRGLDTYLSYRLGLRTFSADESRTVLDTTDAFHLPPLPGFGYLKVDTSHYERFKASYVSGAYRGPVQRGDEDAGPLALEYGAFNTPAKAEDQDGPEPAARRRTTGPTELGVVVGQLENAAPPVRRIWLPPLPAAIALDSVAGPLDVGPRGMQLTGRRGRLQVPLGLLDDPTRQWQGNWVLDLTVAGGHVAFIGGPQSGKTTLLRTLVLSLALTHTPQEVGVYGLDLVGGGLQALAGLPHVGGIAGRADRERAARTVEEVRAMLTAREDLFRDHNIDSVDQLRSLHAAGRLPELASAEIVLVIDGFGALRDDFEELDDAVLDILKRGGGYGIHVVAGMLRWNDVRIAAQSNFGTRAELRLNDPSESSIERKLSETLSADEPGRVLTDGRLFAQVALPRIDGLADNGELGTVLEQSARTVRATWTGELAQPVRVLPHVLEPHLLPGPVAEPRRVPIGLDQAALAPVLLDLFHHDQHLLVLGDSECGKSNLLKTVAGGLIERHGEDEIVFAVMDPRRSLRGVIPEEYNGGYAYNARMCAGLAAAVAGELEKRLPDENAPLEDLEPGRWRGGGPRIVVLVDDYDVLTTAGQSPLAPFLPYLPSAADIGLHFVVTRRVAGASRGMYEPLVQGLRESGASALVMTGDRGEGQLFPGVYAALQPAGRGVIVRRGQPNRLVQTVYTPE